MQHTQHDTQHHTLRQHYQPTTSRLPEWLRRVWLWC